MTDAEERCRNKRRFRTKKSAKNYINRRSIKKNWKLIDAQYVTHFHMRTKLYDQTK